MHVRPSILLFGDSITQFSHGEGPVKYGWGSLLSAVYQRRADVLNRGFSGYNTRHALEIVPKVFGGSVSPCNLLFVTLFFGANDACIPGERQHVPLQEFGDNLTKMVQDIRSIVATKESTGKQTDVPIIILTPPPIDQEAWKECLNLFDYYDRRNDIARAYGIEAKRVAQMLDCPVLDTWELLGGENLTTFREHLCDGLHLSESGNELVFDGLMKLLQQDYPDLCPQAFVDGQYRGRGIPPEGKLWDELC